MKNKILLGFLAVTLGLALLFAACAPAGPAAWPEHVSISHPTGAKMINATGMAAMIEKYVGVSCTAQGPSGGSEADIRNLLARTVELAMNSTPAMAQAWVGEGSFAKDGPIKSLRTVFLGYQGLWHIITTEKSGIKTFTDIKGKIWGGDVMIGSAVTDIAREGLLKMYGMTPADYTGIPITKFGELVEMMLEGRADVVAFWGGLPSKFAMELASKLDIHYISLPPDMAAKVPQFCPGNVAAPIPAGTYQDQKQDAVCVMHYTSLLALDDLPEDLVYEICKAIGDHPDELKAIHPTSKHWIANLGSMDTPLPYHDGVIKYLKEKGMWTSQHESWQKALLK